MADTEYDYDKLRSAIAASESSEAPVMVSAYVVLAVTIEADGGKSVRMISDCDQSYEVLGLLHHGLNVTRHSKYRGETD